MNLYTLVYRRSHFLTHSSKCFPRCRGSFGLALSAYLLRFVQRRQERSSHCWPFAPPKPIRLASGSTACAAPRMASFCVLLFILNNQQKYNEKINCGSAPHAPPHAAGEIVAAPHNALRRSRSVTLTVGSFVVQYHTVQELSQWWCREIINV